MQERWLQNEKIKLSLEKRIKFINLLTLCNYSNIEVGSFVSPKWIPQMEHSDIVYKKIKKIERPITHCLFLI